VLARLSRTARWAVVAAVIAAATLIGATSSGAVTEPETSIYDYNIYHDNADLWFRSNVPDATFECRLDNEPFAPCVSPVNYRGLPEGTHRFEVRAVDSSGTVDSFPANLTVTSAPEPPPPPPAPPNDNWYGAEGISGTSGSVQGTNVNATRQWDEPFNPDGAERTVWYTWTAGRNATVTFSAAADGFTPRVSIYLGSDAERAFLLSSGVGSASVTTHVGFEYHISVDGVDGGSGPFTLSWAYEQTGPANDYFTEAEKLTGESGSLSASTVGATVEANEPRHDGSSGENTGHSIWYRWTAPAAGTAIFTTEGSSFDTDLAAYTGSAVDSLIIRGWYEPDLNPWTKWSRLELQVEPGHVYSIVVDGQDGATGDVQLNWRMALDTGDSEAPTVEMWSPQPGANVDGTVTFMADAYDNEAVDRVMYFIEPNGHSGSPWLVGEAREWPYAVELDTSVLEPGLYSVHARAVDASGNSASYGFDITVGTGAADADRAGQLHRRGDAAHRGTRAVQRSRD
jgi:Bacterial Ig domain